MSVLYFGWKRKKQKLVEAKSGLVRMKAYLEINNRVKYFYRIFWMRPLSHQTFGTVIGPQFQCHDFENFENRSTKPVYITLNDDTHKRS